MRHFFITYVAIALRVSFNPIISSNLMSLAMKKACMKTCRKLYASVLSSKWRIPNGNFHNQGTNPRIFELPTTYREQDKDR